MRLFDKVLVQSRSDGFADYVKARDVIVVACDGVVADFCEKEKDSWNLDEHAPYCRSPWQACFLEWNVPKRMKWTGGVVVDNQVQQCGCLIEAFDADECEDSLPFEQMRERVRESGATSASVVHLVTCEGGKAIVIPLTWLWEINSTGGLIRFCAISTASIPSNVIHSCHLIQYMACTAISFANCKNVKLEDVTEELQPEPKIRRRLRIPEVKRYTLNIAGHVARPSRDYNKGPQGVMPFHLCRGHFATYTADKPMFGNPKLVGRYWHPPHMKGKKENGEIVKDYAIQGSVV